MSNMTAKQECGKGSNRPVPQPSFLQDIIVSLAGAGDIINARFQVNEKMKQPGPTYLQDEKTGTICKVIAAPKIGLLMTRISGRRKNLGNYAYGIFDNPNYVVRPGSLVTFVAGEYRKEHIPVVI
jgi:hypothetical protein